MAGSVNKVIILGNLGKDPEVRNFPNGGRVCNFSVATSDTWRDKSSGEKQERTQWHNISILNEPLVNIAERFLKKGSKVFIEGQLETRKWQDSSGTDRYSTEVVLRPYKGELALVDSRNDLNQMKDTSTNDELISKSENESNLKVDDFDDEIPF